MTNIERNFEIEVKPSEVAVENEPAVMPVVDIPPIAGGSGEFDGTQLTKGKIKRHKALEETVRVVRNVDILSSSDGEGRAFRGVIKK